MIIDLLKAIAAYYHACHLGAKDYAIHLLFDRMLEPIPGEVDALSELLIASGDESPLDFIVSLKTQIEMFENITVKPDKRTALEQAIKLEQALLELINAELPKQPEGIKNNLSSIAENHLRNVYLIKQALSGII